MADDDSWTMLDGDDDIPADTISQRLLRKDAGKIDLEKSLDLNSSRGSRIKRIFAQPRNPEILIKKRVQSHREEEELSEDGENSMKLTDSFGNRMRQVKKGSSRKRSYCLYNMDEEVKKESLRKRKISNNYFQSFNVGLKGSGKVTRDVGVIRNNSNICRRFEEEEESEELDSDSELGSERKLGGARNLEVKILSDNYSKMSDFMERPPEPLKRKIFIEPRKDWVDEFKMKEVVSTEEKSSGTGHNRITKKSTFIRTNRRLSENYEIERLKTDLFEEIEDDLKTLAREGGNLKTFHIWIRLKHFKKMLKKLRILGRKKKFTKNRKDSDFNVFFDLQKNFEFHSEYFDIFQRFYKKLEIQEAKAFRKKNREELYQKTFISEEDYFAQKSFASRIYSKFNRFLGREKLSMSLSPIGSDEKLGSGVRDSSLSQSVYLKENERQNSLKSFQNKNKQTSLKFAGDKNQQIKKMKPTEINLALHETQVLLEELEDSFRKASVYIENENSENKIKLEINLNSKVFKQMILQFLLNKISKKVGSFTSKIMKLLLFGLIGSFLRVNIGAASFFLPELPMPKIEEKLIGYVQKKFFRSHSKKAHFILLKFNTFISDCITKIDDLLEKIFLSREIYDESDFTTYQSTCIEILNCLSEMQTRFEGAESPSLDSLCKLSNMNLELEIDEYLGNQDEIYTETVEIDFEKMCEAEDREKDPGNLRKSGINLVDSYALSKGEGQGIDNSFDSENGDDALLKDLDNDYHGQTGENNLVHKEYLGLGQSLLIVKRTDEIEELILEDKNKPKPKLQKSIFKLLVDLKILK